MPIHSRPFWGVLGHIPPNDVTYCRKPKKDRPRAESRYLSHKPRKSVARFELGVGARKKREKRTGQEKSHKSVIFHLFVEKPPLKRCIWKKICFVGDVLDVITCASFKMKFFQGLRFYRGSNFLFSYWFLNGPYNSAALLRCLWYLARWFTLILSVQGQR